MPNLESEKKKIWEERFGSASDKELEVLALSPLLQDLDRQGKIGRVVVDVGSGEYPVAGYIPDYNRKLISIDLCGKTKASHGYQRIKGDIEKVEDESAFTFKKAIATVCKLLDIDPRIEQNKEQADTMIFSHILNYVDYQRVLGALAEYLKPGGRFIIFNKPDYTFNRKLLSEKGVKSNKELRKFLEESNFEIEIKDFPEKGINDKNSEDQEMMILVARKIKREKN